MNIFRHKTMDSVLRRLPQVMSYPTLGIDTETTGLDPFTHRLVCVQIANGVNDEVDVVDLRGDNFQHLFSILNNYTGCICLHNAAFDLSFIYANYRCCLYLNLFDTELAERVIAGGRRWGGSLAATAARTLNIELNKSIRNEFTMPLFSGLDFSDDQIQYSALDAWVLPRIAAKQKLDLEETNQTRIAELEFKVVPAVVKARLKGIGIDSESWKKIANESLAAARISKNELQRMLGWNYSFNPNSEHEVIAAMKRQDIEVPMFHDKPTTQENFIKRIKHPFIEKLLEYREHNKGATTYGNNFLNRIHHLTGRIHPEVKQIGADSGRMISDMQQIPKEDKYRQCFVAADGYSMLSADFSSQEIVLMAEDSKDPALIKVFRDGLDRHTSAAADLFGIPYDQVTKDQRNICKTLNFGLSYGSSAWNMAMHLNISQKRAELLVRDYWEAYKYLKKWQTGTGLLAWTKGYAETFLGRRRYFENLEKNAVMRMGANFRIQGSAVDMTKRAIILVDEYLRDNPKYDATIVNFIHDELDIEAREAFAPELAEKVEELMCKAGNEFVNVVNQKADVKVGKCWL